MTKIDGSLQFKGKPTPLMQVLLRRRSVRKYEAKSATPDQVRYVEGSASEFARRMAFTSPRVVVLPRGEQLDAVVAGATSGVLGKINPWLVYTKASHLVLCGAVYPDPKPGSIERAIAESAMTMQVAVLAATEVGLGTCWMAGIHHERVEMAYSMPDGARLVAISTLGSGPERMRLSWDAVAYHLVSKRRKPMHRLWMQEGWMVLP